MMTAAAAEHPGTLQISVTGDRISIDARDVPLAEVLLAIGREARVDVSLYGELDTRINSTFNDVPVDEALRRLVGDAALVMIHDPGRTGSAAHGLAEIWVYARGGESQAVVLLPRDPESEPSPVENPVTTATPALSAADLLDGLDLAARIRLVDELAMRGDAEAVRALESVLAQAEEVEVRGRALTGLARLGEPAVDALAAGLADTDEGIREKTVGHLGSIGGERALLGLGQVVFGERDPEVRRRAVNELARQGGEAAAAFLRAAADKDPDENVRAAARNALEPP